VILQQCFASSSVETLIKYYDIFQRNEKKKANTTLRIATIFSYASNEDDADANGFLPEELIGCGRTESPCMAYKHTAERS
jgi:hypothetical protein